MLDYQPDHRPPRQYSGSSPCSPVRTLVWWVAAAAAMTLVLGACGLASASDDLEAAPAPFSADPGQDAGGGGADDDPGSQNEATAEGAEPSPQNQVDQDAAQGDGGGTTTTSEPDELPNPTPVPSEKDKNAMKNEDLADEGRVEGEMAGSHTESTTKGDEDCHDGSPSSGSHDDKVVGNHATADKEKGCGGDRIDPAGNQIDEQCGDADCHGGETGSDDPPDPCPDGTVSGDNCDPGVDDGAVPGDDLPPIDDLVPTEPVEPGLDAGASDLDQLEEEEQTVGGLDRPGE